MMFSPQGGAVIAFLFLSVNKIVCQNVWPNQAVDEIGDITFLTLGTPSDTAKAEY